MCLKLLCWGSGDCFVCLFSQMKTLPCSSKYSQVHRMVTTCSRRMDQPGKVVNPTRGQLNRENEDFPVPVRA